MSTAIERLVRPDLRQLTAYAAASAERDLIRLHANEAPRAADGSVLNRYPEPQPRALVERLASLYAVDPGNLLVTRGSDDAIDLLVRCFCRAGRDDIAVCTPTFGMYAMSARLQNAGIRNVPLRSDDFAPDVEAIGEACADNVRLLFLCSPNNPTGNMVANEDIADLCRRLQRTTLVVVDEAYIEFATRPSVTALLRDYPNLVVLRTLSKALALAGVRIGALIGNADLTALLRPAMPPYPLSTPAIDAALGALDKDSLDAARERIADTRVERERLRAGLDELDCIRRTWPSEANFILAEVDDPAAMLQRCHAAGILIRDMSTQPGLGSHVRITVGTAGQNRLLLETLR